MGANSNSYDKGDAAKETGASAKETSAAWHDARNHAVETGHLVRGSGPGTGGHGKEFSRTDSSGEKATGFWSSIFGK